MILGETISNINFISLNVFFIPYNVVVQEIVTYLRSDCPKHKITRQIYYRLLIVTSTII